MTFHKINQELKEEIELMAENIASLEKREKEAYSKGYKEGYKRGLKDLMRIIGEYETQKKGKGA